MTRVRTVELVGSKYRVSDDPHDILGCLLGFMASPVLAADAPASQRFAPDGQGLAVPDNLVAVRAEPFDLAELQPDEIPADLDREWWIIYLDRPHGQHGTRAVMIIEGNELRSMLYAAGLWESSR